MNNDSAGQPIPISTQKSLATSHDPGWNDPPKWAYSQSPTASGTPPKRVLNKRVAFPLSSTPPKSNFDPYQPLTPPPANLPPPPTTPATMTFSARPASHASFDIPAVTRQEHSLADVLENFEIVIRENEETNGKVDEVRRRLDVMKTAWKEDKLDDAIRQKIVEISKALKEKDVELADKIHVSLMVEHGALCSSWISGIRHVILSLKEKTAQTNSTTENAVSPYLLPTDSQLPSAEQ